MSNNGFNFAKAFGIRSVAAAAVFAVLYLPLAGWFVVKTIRSYASVFFTLTLFCHIRIAAFTLRAILAGSEGAGENLQVFIAEQVLSSLGFVGLLYSAYTLVMDRDLLTDQPPTQNPLLRLVKNRLLFRGVMTAAIVLGIIGITDVQDSDPSKVKEGTNLRKASTIILLLLTILQAYRTVMVVWAEKRSTESYKRHNEQIGQKHGSLILCAISVLLLIREIFATATMSNLARQNNEHLWYPFVALTELVAVVCYATPGLVPSRAEMRKYETERVPTNAV